MKARFHASVFGQATPVGQLDQAAMKEKAELAALNDIADGKPNE